MKKILLLLSLFFLAQEANAQFLLTPNGLVNRSDYSKNYLVYEFDSVDQVTLYTKALNYVHTTYNSPKDVLSQIPSETITIHGMQPNKIGILRKNKIDRKVLGEYEKVFDISYTINIRIKDNKIRIDTPEFSCYQITPRGKTILMLSGGASDNRIFNQKTGAVEKPEAKEQIEFFFNTICASIQEAIKSKEDEDW